MSKFLFLFLFTFLVGVLFLPLTVKSQIRSIEYFPVQSGDSTLQSAGGVEPSDSIYRDQMMMDISYPILVTEIKTFDGRTYRGRLLAEKNSDFYHIVGRSKKAERIPKQSVAELAWTTGDKREYSFYFGYGMYGLSMYNGNILPAYGYQMDIGWELPSDWFLYVPFNMGVDGLYGDEDPVSAFFSLEFYGGYRFNRSGKNFQSLSFGGGLGSVLFESFSDPGSPREPPIVFGAQYDYEISTGPNSGLALFTKFQVFPGLNSHTRLILGLTWRFYSIRMSESTAISTTHLFYGAQ
ncbi:MAG: hypothetical protein JJU02_12965 [Cryomorphaceae bacterium]|nr:hypothetical protein [Cryomorphaceae bacterium]